eukprot:GHVO01022024.1.p1 GENE.GHVO01022024.1~~GHVO01022024.1.p1  ORF type:complete len:245 (+),score=53.93 GHVO01022024.1:3-737(+)
MDNGRSSIRRCYSTLSIRGKANVKNESAAIYWVRLGRRSSVHPTGPVDFVLSDHKGVKRVFMAASPVGQAKWISSLGAVIEDMDSYGDEDEVYDTTSPNKGEEFDVHPSPLKIPGGGGERMLYGLLLPFRGVLWMTCPDITDDTHSMLIGVGLLSSVTWIGLCSYVMCRGAEEIAAMLRVEEEVIGLTVAAAGAVFPNVIASLAVARQGLGSMAVANAIGGCIFTLLVAVGFPYFISAQMGNEQ